MPCNDITETLEVRVDFDDRISGYALNKRSCGRTIGGETLLPMVIGLDVDRLLELPIDTLIPEFERYGDVDQFLLMKQFGAICAALSVYRGDGAGNLGQHFVLHSLEYDEVGTRLVGEVAIEAVVEEIKACKGCGSGASHDHDGAEGASACGTKPRAKRTLPTL